MVKLGAPTNLGPNVTDKSLEGSRAKISCDGGPNSALTRVILIAIKKKITKKIQNKSVRGGGL